MASTSICAVDGCAKAVLARQLCNAHYLRDYRHGHPTAGASPRSPLSEQSDWLDGHVDYADDDCLRWPFGTEREGYCSYGKTGAHREMCRRAHGEPPTSAHEAAHSCGRGRAGCVNPRHLRWATSAENQADKIRHGTALRGERNHRAQLTAAEALQVFGLKGSAPPTLVGKRFSVSRHVVSSIWRGDSWSWLTGA